MMYGDFSRVTFRPDRHYSAVLVQQGRVQLDADANEQAEILLHYLRTLATDLLGPYGGPAGAAGFAITGITPPSSGSQPDVIIGPGRYYVSGLLCEVEDKDERGQPQEVRYSTQPDLHIRSSHDEDLLPDPPFVAYLRVFERVITALEDPYIRETALGVNGPDTCARTKVVWQVWGSKLGLDLPSDITREAVLTEIWPKWLAEQAQADLAHRGKLRAQARRPPGADTDVCAVSPEASYRGAENQLYRVEIHTGGAGDPVGAPAPKGTATFKWSREAGSVAFAIESLAVSTGGGTEVIVVSLGRDDVLDLDVGDWVEIVDDNVALRNDHDPLLKATAIDPQERRVTLDGQSTSGVGMDPALHPTLLRWDEQEGPAKKDGLTLGDDNAFRVIETTNGDDGWLELEDGVTIQFQPQGNYQAGDYWLIPARTATGDVEWPGEDGNPFALPPKGVHYHYAPLALVHGWDNVEDLRSCFAPLAGGPCPGLGPVGKAQPESEQPLPTRPKPTPGRRRPRS